MSLLKQLNRDRKSTLLVVTHDPKVASMADRILEMRDGVILNGTKSKVGVKKKVSRKKK